jgi:hypothetical protein
VFEFLGQAGLEGRELRGGEGEDVDGAGGKVLELCHFIVAVSFEKGVGRVLRGVTKVMWGNSVD